MADSLVERLTGQKSAADVPLMVNLVMTDSTLLAGDPEPVTVPGYGPIPAGLARDLVADATKRQRAALRRLYTQPGTGRLVKMESRSRRFPKALGEFLELRDQACRTPWCDAPIRHHDHVTAHADGGPTSVENGQGLCEACNYAKQAPGWLARPGPDEAVVTVTPTGRRYTSPEPDPPGREPTSPGRRPLGTNGKFARLIAAVRDLSAQSLGLVPPKH